MLRLRHGAKMLSLLGIALIVNSCLQDGEITSPVPEITGISPSAGIAGDEVIITGSNFGKTPTENTVQFNGVTAEIKSAAKNTLTAIVPADATTGKIIITVDDLAVVSSFDFIITQSEAPTVDSFEPQKGRPGDVVLITGENYSETLEENKVMFNDVAAIITEVTKTSITVSVPDEATTGKLMVEVNGLSGASSSDFTVLSLLSITSIDPLAGTVGAEVTITGTNFSSTLTENEVMFNGAVAKIVSATEETIIVVAPLAATNGKVSVSVNGSTVVSSSDFEVLVPAINSFTPSIAAAGDELTILGENFSPDLQSNIVSVNGVEAIVNSATTNQLTATIPEGSGVGKVSVSIGEQSIESSFDFEYIVDIPRDGLIGFYPFDGNANDESGSGLHGVSNGATLVTDRFGNQNQAYSFDGVDDYIDMGNPTELQISDQITVGLWTRSSSFVKNRMLVSKTDRVDGYIFDTGELGDGSQGYSVFVYSSTATGTNFARLGEDYVADEWTFLAFTLDDTNITFYQDAVETFSYDKATPLTDGSTGNFQIGGGDNHFFFGGEVDDVAVYNKTLSKEEILQLYNQNLTKK
ncbi:MAG: IPT/TIG domain-containing protein [Cyclobacteriaceae bacterium]